MNLKSLITATALLLALLAGPQALVAAEPGIDAEPVVNINQAGPDELAEALNGVGETKARAIVEYRDSNGHFESAEALTAVKGIGDATVEKNEERIRVE